MIRRCGILLWLSSRGIITWRLTWSQDWPVIFIIIGGVMLIKYITRQFRRAPAAVPAGGAAVGTTATDAARPACWLKIIVCENNSTTPSVRLTLPLAVLNMATKLGGSLNLNIPESARAKMKEKGIELDPQTCEHLDELFDQLAVNGRLEAVHMQARVCRESGLPLENAGALLPQSTMSRRFWSSTPA